MNNMLHKGDVLTLTAPSGGVVSGTAYLIGALFGVAVVTAAEGEKFAFARKGGFKFQKTTSQAWAEGDPLYFDPATGKLTSVAGNLRRVAVATADALEAATEGDAVIIPSASIAPSTAIADLAAITGGEAPTEAEHNAVRADLAAIKAVLRAHNILAE